jgi:hypothetical protein
MTGGETYPRLTKFERRVLLEIPSLYPDGDSDDLEGARVNKDNLSFSLQLLKSLGLIYASEWPMENPDAPYFRDVSLTPAGELLRRDLARSWFVRLWEREWKWIISTAFSPPAFILSVWNFLHSPAGAALIQRIEGAGQAIAHRALTVVGS